MIERVEIDSDERGFELILQTDGEFDVDVESATFRFRLPAEAAIQLLTQANEQIGPWHTEGQSVLCDFENHLRGGPVPKYVRVEPGEIIGAELDRHGYDDGAERLREAVDLQRKREKENPR